MDISVTHDNFSAKDFNPLPRKEGDGLSCKGLLWIRYFNPLPRKEGDSIVSVTVGVPPISIHSLVKRETQFLVNHLDGMQSISIHSLVKRETYRMRTIPTTTAYFNPLPRKEGDWLG